MKKLVEIQIEKTDNYDVDIPDQNVYMLTTNSRAVYEMLRKNFDDRYALEFEQDNGHLGAVFETPIGFDGVLVVDLGPIIE